MQDDAGDVRHRELKVAGVVGARVDVDGVPVRFPGGIDAGLAERDARGQDQAADAAGRLRDRHVGLPAENALPGRAERHLRDHERDVVRREELPHPGVCRDLVEDRTDEVHGLPHQGERHRAEHPAEIGLRPRRLAPAALGLQELVFVPAPGLAAGHQRSAADSEIAGLEIVPERLARAPALAVADVAEGFVEAVERLSVGGGRQADMALLQSNLPSYQSGGGD